MSFDFTRHSRLGLVVQIVCYTVLCAVCLVLGTVEHKNRLYLLAACAAGGVVTSVILLRSKARSHDADRHP